MMVIAVCVMMGITCLMLFANLFVLSMKCSSRVSVDACRAWEG